MKIPSWDSFFTESIKQILQNNHFVVDIGGGLRINKRKGNRFDPKRAWIIPLLNNVNYKILDPVADYAPDIIGDIHALPMNDNAVDAFICLAVLEHVRNPFKAVSEMLRALKPGGHCLIYAPFIYRYHPLPGYFLDYWRFTEDGLNELFRDFSEVKIINLRGRFETFFHLTPLTRFKQFMKIIAALDRLLKTNTTKQTAGFYLFAKK